MPSLQEQAIKMTKEAINSIFRTARFVPEDKRSGWVPMGEARSTQDQLVEVAQVPYFFVPFLTGETPAPTDPEADKSATAALTTIESAEEACAKSYEVFYAAVAGVSDADLETEVTIPWGKCTKADLIFFPYWNTVYHIGQINYIQTMLGDIDMH